MKNLLLKIPKNACIWGNIMFGRNGTNVRVFHCRVITKINLLISSENKINKNR